MYCANRDFSKVGYTILKSDGIKTIDHMSNIIQLWTFYSVNMV